MSSRSRKQIREYMGKVKNAEGVAAPLEPTPEKFCQKWLSEHVQPMDQIVLEDFVEYGKAYAAAVSKNLQEELAAEIKRREHWQKLAESLYDNASLNLVEMSRLEKEIAALREKP